MDGSDQSWARDVFDAYAAAHQAAGDNLSDMFWCHCDKSVLKPVRLITNRQTMYPEVGIEGKLV